VVEVLTSGIPSGFRAQSTTKPSSPSLWHYVGQGVSAGILLMVLGLAMLVIVVPRLSGAIPLTVLTSSMEPGLPAGTLIVVRAVAPDDVALGDIVTYQMRPGDPAVITHRVTAINLATDGTRTFILKGDNNSLADPDAVSAEQVRGRLWYSVPVIGLVSTVIPGQAKAWMSAGGALLLFGYAGFMLVGGVRDARARRAAAQQTDRAGPAG
jgi:signal peptidase